MATIDQSKTSALEISRYFAAPPERVFDAWVSDDWSKWLPPFQATCRIAAAEKPAPGATYQLNMFMSDGREVEITGKYLEVTRPSKLVLTWTGNYNNHMTTITVLFAVQGAGTMMTLRQDGFHEAEMRDNYQTGWTGPGGSFDKLATVLTT